MKHYEVVYIDEKDEALGVVNKVLDYVGQLEVEYTDLNHFDPNEDNDVFIFAFDYLKNELPFLIMNSLSDLEGKTIMCYVCAPMMVNAQIQATIEKRILPFLPDHCQYLGCFVCSCKYSDKYLTQVHHTLKRQPTNASARAILDHQASLESHPDSNDMQEAISFFQEKIINLS